MTALQGLQNTVSNSVFAAGGVEELAFSERPDGKIAIALTDGGLTERMSSIVSQSIEVIRNRIDELGLGDDRSGGGRHVPGRDPVERIDQCVFPAEIATAKVGEMGPHGIVGRDDVFLDQIVDHKTARAGVTTVPVKVEPVVPVSLTR
jgi:hypothetical protein